MKIHFGILCNMMNIDITKELSDEFLKYISSEYNIEIVSKDGAIIYDGHNINLMKNILFSNGFLRIISKKSQK